ncbi:MAG: hypothetical protein ABSG15_02860 [FCB group bacterium]|jgi:hypothetical protein
MLKLFKYCFIILLLFSASCSEPTSTTPVFSYIKGKINYLNPKPVFYSSDIFIKASAKTSEYINMTANMDEEGNFSMRVFANTKVSLTAVCLFSDLSGYFGYNSYEYLTPLIQIQTPKADDSVNIGIITFDMNDSLYAKIKGHIDNFGIDENLPAIYFLFPNSGSLSDNNTIFVYSSQDFDFNVPPNSNFQIWCKVYNYFTDKWFSTGYIDVKTPGARDSLDLGDLPLHEDKSIIW